jgi:hypothetical protein
MDREWNDKRMDDFADRVDRFEGNVDRRFDQVDRRFDKVEARAEERSAEVEANAKERSARSDAAIASLGEKIERMNRNLVSGFVTLFAAVAAKFLIG